jgi:hypothetical protein
MLESSLRSTRARADWLRPLYRAAEKIPFEKFERNSVQGYRLGRRNVLLARGGIAPHTDPLFQPMGYALVLRVGQENLFKVHRQEPLRLRRGMLIEFTFHRRHSLKQGQDDLFVWLSWDEPESARWVDVLEKIRRDRREYEGY